jgi:NAD(P)-dependent dehydrogenase (short-subunit alcohol dehydrogenase family)
MNSQLVNDAGLGVVSYKLDDDGIERVFGVNVLGHFVFINLLLPLIRATARLPNTPPPRIVNLSSNLHKLAPSSVQFKDLNEINTPDLRADEYYHRSKLAIVLYTKELVERALEPYEKDGGEKIYAVSVHPGAVDTEIQDAYKDAFGSAIGTALKYLQKPLMRSPDAGSLGTLWAAVDPTIEEQNLQGAYITDPGHVGGESDAAKDEKLGENVWNLCTKLIGDKLGKDALLSWGEGSAGGKAKAQANEQ